VKTANIDAFFQQIVPAVEETLDHILPSQTQIPTKLHDAMRYSVFAGGKRLRPALCVAGYSAFCSDWKDILPIAASLELVHTYSLIHDDLPAMDDDDFRRGMPSCHRKYGEAVAILAGDALLTLAFGTIAGCGHFSAESLMDALALLAQAAGTQTGMIGGQVLDLEAAGTRVDSEQLDLIHRSKTGAMIEASIVVGAHLGKAGPDEMQQIRVYGQSLGLAFQIVDDILDETGNGDDLGKTPGKDRAQSKATYPGLHGIEESRRMVRKITAEAHETISGLGDGAPLLTEIANYVETRLH
jgi:geranylgeranyl diphosphate synthase type II